MASDDLTRIRREAFLRALHKSALEQSDVVTAASIAETLGLALPQLGFLVRPLIEEGIISMHGEQGAEYISFEEKGLKEASELLDARPQRAAKVKILCIDTEPQVVQRLKEAGYTTFDVSMGYRTGKRAFPFPAPNEVNLIVCDLKRPACFDSKDWGPGRNDNFKAKILPYDQVNTTFFVRSDRRHAQHRVIYETQLGTQIPGTFGPKDVNRAIVQGGIPFLLFLNQEWVSRIESFPNWFDVQWSFSTTSATQVEIHDPVATLLPELGKAINFKFAIQNKIESGPQFSKNLPKHLTSVAAVVVNNIRDIFGQVIRMGAGAAWLLPATHQNVDIIQLFASRLEQVHKLAPPQEWEKPSAYDLAVKSLTTKHNIPAPAAPKAPEESASFNKIQLFISHSHADAEIAQELINLLRSAIQNLSHDAIRCTSVPGYQLEGGAKTEEQLLTELLGAKVFIGLLSKQSLQSTYVLFELGARWGAKKHLIPLLVAGMTPSELRAPLNNLNAQSASVEAHLYDLVTQVATQLGLLLAKTSVFEGHVKKLAHLSEKEAKTRTTPPKINVEIVD